MSELRTPVERTVIQSQACKVNDTLYRRAALVLAGLLVVYLVLSPTLVVAFSGLGGYIGEKLLGDGTNEVPHLGDGTNEMQILGSGPVVSTLSATGVAASGGGTATLRGNLSNLNGMPQANVWFVWGYSASSMSNTTATSTVFGTGTQTATITGFNTKLDVYYQFLASTDGTSSGSVMSFPKADTGFVLLEVALPIVIALVILVFVLGATGNLVLAMFGSVIGLIAFYVIKAMLEAIS